MFFFGAAMTQPASIPASVPLAQGEKILHVSRWSKFGMVVQILLLSLPLASVSLLLLAEGGDVVGVGGLFGLFAVVTYFLTYLSWQKRLAVVTTRNVLFIAGLSNTLRTIPLEQINQVTTSPGLMTVRSGSIMNTLILRVADAEAMAEVIERARQARSQP